MILGQTLPYVLYSTAKQNEQNTALVFKNEEGKFISWTYRDLLDQVNLFSLALHEIGLKREDKIFFLLDNCKEWSVMDFATQVLGMINVPRGTDVSDSDMKIFIEHVEANAIFFHGEKELTRLLELGVLKEHRKLVSIQPISEELKKQHNVYILEELIESAKQLPVSSKEEFVLNEMQKGKASDIITITYTSGTSGVPKGVCLTHTSFIFQFETVLNRVHLRFGKERVLNILPIWHAYQRVVHYMSLYLSAEVIYSQPVAKVMLADIETMQPTLIPAVPRVFESIYHGVQKQVNKEKPLKKGMFKFFYWTTNLYYDLLSYKENQFFSVFQFPTFLKLFMDIFISVGVFVLYPFQVLGYLLIFRKINKKFGKKNKILLSGGAHLPLYVDKFFRNIGITLIEGYGMTEMAPLVAARSYPRPKIGAIGKILDGVEYYLLDEHGKPSTKKGELFVKSPQMMTGYYKNPTATEEAIIDGFYKTGDIVKIDVNGSIRMVGRTKNIVVLANGENIETEPLESILGQCPYVSYSMVVGQDEKFLGLLISPNIAEVTQFAKEKNISFTNNQELVNHDDIRALFKSFIQANINKSKEFSSTPIIDFIILDREFEINKELTLTLKVKRTYIEKHYFKEIHSLYR